MDKLSPAPMHCPHCGAAYKVVRVEAVTADPLPDKIPCKNCGGDLDTREGAFILKYFLISRRQRRKPLSSALHDYRIRYPQEPLVPSSCSPTAFYETKRPVRTASVMQVREPIFATSVGRWRQYESWLRPLIESAPFWISEKTFKSVWNQTKPLLIMALLIGYFSSRDLAWDANGHSR